MATDPAAPPARSRPDPTRRLWQVPALALGLTAFLAVYNGWLPVGQAGPGSAFLKDLARLRGAAGEANRLIAELYLRNPTPSRSDLEKARDALTIYLTDAGVGTPAVSLFRAKLVLCRVHLRLGDADKAKQLLGHLRDAPAEVRAPA